MILPPRYLKHCNIRLYTDNVAHKQHDYCSFINYLINIGDYKGALLEIRRVEFLKGNITPAMYSNKLLCYRALNNHEDGIFDYESLNDSVIKFDSRVNAQIALLYYETQNYQNAINKLSDEVYNTDTITIYNRYILRALAYSQLRQYDKASIDFYCASKLNSDNYNKNILLLEELSSQKLKNPNLAKVLSIIPGLGYLYSGHKGSAVTALLVNGILGYATYTSIKSQNYGVATLCGVFTLSFYLGNINGASRSAERYNIMIQNNIINQIETINHYNLIN